MDHRHSLEVMGVQTHWDGAQWLELSDGSWAPMAIQPPPPAVPTSVAIAPKGSRNWIWYVLAAVGVCALVGGLVVALKVSVSTAPPAASHVLTGTFTNVNAITSSGYSDRTVRLIKGETLDCSDGDRLGLYQKGTHITVYDAQGSVITTGALGEGLEDLGGCHFSFSIELPDSSAYQIQIASANRYSETRDNLQSKGWRLNLSN